MDKLTAVATLNNLGEVSPDLKKFTDRIVDELESPAQDTVLSGIKTLFTNDSMGSFLVNSLALNVKVKGIEIEVIEPNPVEEVVEEVKPEVEETKSTVTPVIREDAETTQPILEQPASLTPLIV